MDESIQLLVEACREKLIHDPFNSFFFEELLEECAEKASRPSEVWLVLFEYQILGIEDIQFWEQAIEREGCNDWLEIHTQKLIMFSKIGGQVPTGHNIQKKLKYQESTASAVLAAYGLCKWDFQDSQGIFMKLIELLISENRIETARDIYLERFQIPHNQLQQTYETFSLFVSQNFSEQYNSIMRDLSVAMQKTVLFTRTFESYELQIQSDPHNVDNWLEYLQKLSNLNDNVKDLLLAVFYRCVHYSTSDGSWERVWLLVILLARKLQWCNQLLFHLALLWRKAFPRLIRPYSFIIPYIKEESALKSLRRHLRLHITDSFECIEALKALVTAQAVYSVKSDATGMELWEDMAFYSEKIPSSLDLVRRWVAISYDMICLKPDVLVTLHYEANKYKADSFIFALRYFSSAHDGQVVLEYLIEQFEKKLGSFDKPQDVFPYVENYLCTGLTPETYDDAINRLQLLRMKLSDFQMSENREMKRNFETENLVHKPKRVKDDKSSDQTDHDSSDSTHRNRELFTIHLKGFDTSVTDNDIEEFFLGYGNPISILRNSSENPSAKVEFLSEQEVLTCLTRDQKHLKGNIVTIERVFGSTLWLTNYPSDYGVEQLKAMIETSTDTAPLSIRLPSQNTIRERRFCYVDFETAESAANARKKLDGLEIGNFRIQAEISNPSLKRQRPSLSPKHQIYVKNLHFQKSSEESLRACFSEFGEIDSISMPLKGDHKSSLNSGYAFITFKSEDSAKKAIATKSINLDDRQVEIYALKPREAHARDAKFYDDARSVSLQNVGDSVTQKQLTAHIESLVGPVERLTMQPKSRKALVEFKTVADAGKAGFVLANHDFGGQKLVVADKKKYFEEEKTIKVPMMMSPMMMKRRAKR